jgi:outer membrane protein TolC
MGRNVSLPVEVVPAEGEPPFQRKLAEALQTAVDNRREFAVARRSVEVAAEGLRVAKADFLPRVYLRGQLDEVDGGGIQTGQTAVGAIHLEWALFEGGRRLGEKRAAGAALQGAVAQAQLVADTIGFEVNQAFWTVDDARQRITLARTSIAQAQENYRLVLNKYRAGDATPTDLVDAETTLTRAQQSFNTALYDYLTALARLDYAMGTTPDSASAAPAEEVCTSQGKP